MCDDNDDDDNADDDDDDDNDALVNVLSILYRDTKKIRENFDNFNIKTLISLVWHDVRSLAFKNYPNHTHFSHEN